jgi:hypothetical protein
MYYLELIDRFWDFNKKVRLGSSAISMYLYLLKLGNDNDSYKVVISDVALGNALGLTRKTVKPTKEKLLELGLIEFESKSGFPCNYRILLNYSFDIPIPEKIETIKIEKVPSLEIVEKQETLKINDPSDQVSPKISKANDKVSNADTSKINKSIDAPELEEFIRFAVTLEDYEPLLDSVIKEKYHSWLENDWRNSSGRPISNWKSSLKSILPYLKNSQIDNKVSAASIPNIKRPKTS